MYRTKKVQALDGYRLSVEFADGVCGVIDLQDRLFGSVFEPLRDPAFFRQVSIDEFGVICWPNGADLAPDALYRRLVSESASESVSTSTKG
ncbi:MAG: DUF2442 domain-containing protein [Bryobacterales bacterium]